MILLIFNLISKMSVKINDDTYDINTKTIFIKKEFNLTAFPEEMYELKNLCNIYCEHNLLSSLSPKIGNLQNLTDLRIDNTNLSVLPSEIGKLIKLTTLSLSNNKIISLPAEIGQRSSL